MKPMNDSDALLRLLVEFFELPHDTRPENITQPLLASWDSLAMVQLITELEGKFLVNFDIEEIQRLRSYDEIRDALFSKGISFRVPPISGVASTAVESGSSDLG
jgi:acyl carrier protein